jgi:tetratricopeptide (TPR) repeat protein
LIELDPHSAKDYCLRAEAYLNKGDYYLARLDATQAIRLEPNNALAYFYRADACCKGRDFEPALANLADAVRLEKKAPQRDRQFERRGGELYEEIYQNQARAYADGRQWEKVVDCLLAIDHSPYLGWTDVTPEKRAQRLRQMAQAYQDLGSDRLESKNWDDAIQGFGKAISVDKSLARQLDPQLARAYGERGFDHAKHRELTQAGLDLNTALGIAYKFDKDYAPVYRLCGLTCCLLAEDCRQRGPFADEKGYWKDAIQFLKWAIRLAPDLEYELRRPLDDAQRNSARLSAPAGSTPVGLPVPYRSNDLPPATYAPAPAPVTVLN